MKKEDVDQWIDALRQLGATDTLLLYVVVFFIVAAGVAMIAKPIATVLKAVSKVLDSFFKGIASIVVAVADIHKNHCAHRLAVKELEAAREGLGLETHRRATAALKASSGKAPVTKKATASASRSGRAKPSKGRS